MAVQLGRLLQLLQLMAAMRGAARGASARLWGDGVGAQLGALSASLREQEQTRLRALASRAEAGTPAEAGHASSHERSELAELTANGLQDDVQDLKLSQAAAQRISALSAEGGADRPAAAPAANPSSSNAGVVSEAAAGPNDAASMYASSLGGSEGDAMPTMKGLGDDYWAEIHDKIRRQGGVVNGDDSRARQLRQECLVLLSEMVAPARGKVD